MPIINISLLAEILVATQSPSALRCFLTQIQICYVIHSLHTHMFLCVNCYGTWNAVLVKVTWYFCLHVCVSTCEVWDYGDHFVTTKFRLPDDGREDDAITTEVVSHGVVYLWISCCNFSLA